MLWTTPAYGANYMLVCLKFVLCFSFIRNICNDFLASSPEVVYYSGLVHQFSFQFILSTGDNECHVFDHAPGTTC
jgi:hypothetical protein